MRFNVTTESGNDTIRQLCEQHVNGLWIPDHLTPQQAEVFALDHFKRWVAGELELLGVEEPVGSKYSAEL